MCILTHMHKHNRLSWLFLVLVSLAISLSTPAAHAEGLFAAPVPPNGKYVVAANDTLWDIATRFGITVAQLTAANPNVKPNTLRPGMTLTIPSKATPATSAASLNAAAAAGAPVGIAIPAAASVNSVAIDDAAPVAEAAPVTKVLPTTPAPADAGGYVVKPNDTLWDIATRYRVFVNDLLAANPGVDPQRLMVGQILVIPGANGAPAGAAPAQPVKATYTVESDDTLWDIAANYGLSLAELLAANPGVDPRALMVGQQLTIPGISQQALSARLDTPAAAAPAPATAPAAAPPAAPLPTTAGLAPELAPWAQDMVNRINEKRVAGGRAPLTWNDQLAAAAQGQAEDCARRNRGSHVGSDGARLPARLERAGYGPYVWQGENWANARNVERAMHLWWNEPPGADPHVQNIMASRATEIGVGVARGAWGYYFIADFGSR